MLKRYALERQEGEHFCDWTIRAGIIKETTEGKTFHDDVAEEESEDEAWWMSRYRTMILAGLHEHIAST